MEDLLNIEKQQVATDKEEQNKNSTEKTLTTNGTKKQEIGEKVTRSKAHINKGTTPTNNKDSRKGPDT